ncbi:MAG: efflux RND transporter permease subunit [Gammaproteobacteria bacterium]
MPGAPKLDVFLEFLPPRIVIHTEAPGLSAEEVEALVTRPIEYGLNGTPDWRSFIPNRSRDCR